MIDRFLLEDAKEREIVKAFMVCKAEKVIESENWIKLMTCFPKLATELIRNTLRKNQERRHLCRFCLFFPLKHKPKFVKDYSSEMSIWSE